MNFIQRVLGRFSKQETEKQETEERSGVYDISSSAAMSIFNQSDDSDALKIAAVWRAVGIINQAIATTPLELYERQDDGTRKLATGHPLYRLMHLAPNPRQTSLSVREMMNTHVLLYGMGFAYLDWSGAGTLRGIYPIDSRVFSVRFERGQVRFFLNGTTEIPEHQLLYIPGLTLDGINPLSVIAHAKATIDLENNAGTFGNSFFKNGAHMGAVIESENAVPADAKKILKRDIKEVHTGAAKSFKTLLLENGLKYNKIDIPLNDAQFLETRKFTKTEIATWFGLPPHMLGELSNATYSNIEQQGIEVVRYCFRPWARRWEQSLNMQLLSEKEQEKYYFEFNLDDLLRGDLISRANAYAIFHDRGIFTADEIRGMEHMNPLTDGLGGHPVLPLNYTTRKEIIEMGEKPDVQDPPAEDEPEEDEPTPEDPADEDPDETDDRADAEQIEHRAKHNHLRHRNRIIDAYRVKTPKVLSRLVDDEIADMEEALKEVFPNENSRMEERSLQNFWIWLERYLEGGRSYTDTRIRGLFEQMAEEIVGVSLDEVGAMETDVADFVDEYVNTFTFRHAKALRQWVQANFEKNMNFLSARQSLLDFKNQYISGAGKDEPKRLSNAVSRKVWEKVGVQKLRWQISGDTCPICKALDGRVVGIEQNFVSVGDELDNGTSSDGQPTVHRFRRNYKTPPIHAGCDCNIVPER